MWSESRSVTSNVNPAKTLRRATSAPAGPPGNASLLIAASGPPDCAPFVPTTSPSWNGWMPVPSYVNSYWEPPSENGA